MRQRGEGKLGCLFSMLILGVIASAAYKGIPVYYSNSELVDACDLIASGASRKPPEVVEREVKDKAKELGIAEALTTKNAIMVSKSGYGETGKCVITLRYKRVIDFYGFYQWTLETNKQISKPIFENL